MPIEKICKITKRPFEISDQEIEVYTKMHVPIPEVHPEEALVRRFSFRNEIHLYKSTDAHDGKTILSQYGPETPIQHVYEQEYWRSDNWNPFDYGRDYDFNRPFFEQFKELLFDVPWPNLTNWNSVNNEYCNFTTDNKGCYMVVGGDYNENCMFSKFCFYSKDSSDLYWSTNMELSYECIDCSKCFKTRFAQNSHDCANSWLLYNCVNCQDCFGCVNLRNKNYCIWNEQYTKEEYEKKLQELDPWNRENLSALRKEFESFKSTFPVKYADLIQCENCTGDHVSEARNCHNAFDWHTKVENCRNVAIGGFNATDIMNSDHLGHKAELIVNSVSIPTGRNIIGSWIANTCTNLEHCALMARSSNCFGCVGLSDVEYCIFNTRYSKEEYEALVTKIRKHMVDMPYSEHGISYTYGDFLPQSFSPFSYNESVAQEYFPKSKEEALAQGFSWKDKTKNEYAVTQTTATLWKTIAETPDTITQDIIECRDKEKEYSPGAFRIIAQEVQLYRQLQVPIPEYSPNARRAHRQAKRNPYTLWSRTTEDGVYVMTPFAPGRPEIILSEEAYKKEVL